MATPQWFTESKSIIFDPKWSTLTSHDGFLFPPKSPFLKRVLIHYFDWVMASIYRELWMSVSHYQRVYQTIAVCRWRFINPGFFFGSQLGQAGKFGFTRASSVPQGDHFSRQWPQPLVARPFGKSLRMSWICTSPNLCKSSGDWLSRTLSATFILCLLFPVLLVPHDQRLRS